MFFLYGILTSIHCVGMCGGIVMSVTVGEKEEGRFLLRKQALYHTGRLLAAAILGILLGLTGELFYKNAYFKLLFPLVCGSVMVIMGIVHMGILQKLAPVFHSSALSGFFSQIKKKGAFAAGALTVLLPCGALHSAEVYAAGTGNAVEALICMVTFVAGTIPALLLFGMCHAAVTGVARRITLKISGIITVLLGIKLILKALAMQ